MKTTGQIIIASLFLSLYMYVLSWRTETYVFGFEHYWLYFDHSFCSLIYMFCFVSVITWAFLQQPRVYVKETFLTRLAVLSIGAVLLHFLASLYTYSSLWPYNLGDWYWYPRWRLYLGQQAGFVLMDMPFVLKLAVRGIWLASLVYLFLGASFISSSNIRILQSSMLTFSYAFLVQFTLGLAALVWPKSISLHPEQSFGLLWTVAMLVLSLLNVVFFYRRFRIASSSKCGSS